MATRALSPVPARAIDERTGEPFVGSFRGGVPKVDWRSVAGPLTRLRLHKRWVYLAIATSDVYLGLAVLRMGYAANAFAYVYDAASSRLLARRSWIAQPAASQVGLRGGRECRATFRTKDARIDVAPLRHAVLSTGGLELEADLDPSPAPPAIGAIAQVEPGRFDATEKRALLGVRGRLRVEGRTISLDGALAGYDFTSGLLPRRTRWRWGFALGNDAAGAPFAVNLVQGFVGEPECAAWTRGELLPLTEGRFTFDPARPASPWHVSTADGAAQLTMTPGVVHAEKREVLLVRSRFVQPCGAWSGSIALPDRPPLVVGRALGVTEDQDVTW